MPKISALPAGTDPTGPEQIPAVQGGVTVELTVAQIAADASKLTKGTVSAAQMPALTGDISSSIGTVATTLATVNANVGAFGSATQSVQFTANGKGLLTAAANVTITPAIGNVTGLGTGVATALTVNVGTAGAPVVYGGALGTPSSGVATNLSGTASSLTAGQVTNANLTGDVTTVGNAATINLAITPTWTGTHTFSNGTFSALFSGGPIGVNNAGPTAPLHVGGVAAASAGSNILSARASAGATSVHGFAENSTINLSASGQGMDSYDARMVVTGSQIYDHLVSYQSRAVYGSSGLITNAYGGYDGFTANGPATNQYGWYTALPTGTSTIQNSYGFYCEALTKGAVLNYAFFSAGTTPSKFGGNVDVNGLSLAGVDQTGAWAAYTPSVTAQSGTFTTTTTTGRW